LNKLASDWFCSCSCRLQT